MAKQKTYRKKKLNPALRIFYLISGVFIASALIIFSFRWEDLPIRFTMAGLDITPYAMAPLVVLTGILASTLTKSAFLGKYEADS